MSKLKSIKVFLTGKYQGRILKKWNLRKECYIQYPGFLVLHIDEKTAAEIEADYAFEDMTEQFSITEGGDDLLKDVTEIRFENGELVAECKDALDKLGAGAHHYLVQFSGPVKDSWINTLRKSGIKFIEPFQQFTYVIRGKSEDLLAAHDFKYVRWVGHLPHYKRDKVKLEAEGDEKGAPSRTLVIEFFEPDRVNQAKRRIREIGRELSDDGESIIRIINHRKTDGVLTIRAERSEDDIPAIAEAVSQIHGVRVVRRRFIKMQKNDVATGIMGVDASREEMPELTGKGEIVAVCDGGFDIGRADDVHPDFEGRVIAVKSYEISAEDMEEVYNKRRDSGAADISDGHGTHVAGSVLGSGAASKDAKEFNRPVKGVAPEAKLVFQAVEQEMEWKESRWYKDYGRFSLAGLSEDITGILRYAHRKGARIHSNSWGGSEPGEYDNTCRLMDKFIWENKDFAIVVCAGNEGTDKNFKGEIQATTVQSPATAKNVITVGASENLRPEFNDRTYGIRWPKDYPVSPYWNSPMSNNPYQVVAFSSRGPTNDGRIKPDIVAPGTYILSTRSRAIPHKHQGWESIPNNLDYFYLGGTSMATPLVSGTCALLRQYFREWYGIEKPSAALLKAALIGGAIKLPGYSPAGIMADNHQGYGRVNLKNICTPDGNADVLVYDSLQWKDRLKTGQYAQFRFRVNSSNVPLRIAMAYTDFPGPNLVNNLNLLLFRSKRSGLGKFHVGYGESENMRMPDATNNTEVIQIDRPEPGNWILQVIASNVPKGPQDFALFFSGDFRTHPYRD